MDEVWCKDEGKDSKIYTNRNQAMQACVDSDKCVSVVTDCYYDCPASQKFQLCNGFEFERNGGDRDSAVGWRKECELP